MLSRLRLDGIVGVGAVVATVVIAVQLLSLHNSRLQKQTLNEALLSSFDHAISRSTPELLSLLEIQRIVGSVGEGSRSEIKPKIQNALQILNDIPNSTISSADSGGFEQAELRDLEGYLRALLISSDPLERENIVQAAKAVLDVRLAEHEVRSAQAQRSLTQRVRQTREKRMQIESQQSRAETIIFGTACIALLGTALLVWRRSGLLRAALAQLVRGQAEDAEFVTETEHMLTLDLVRERIKRKDKHCAFLEAVLQAQSNAVLVLDAQGNITSCNQSAFELLGDSDQIVGRALDVFFVEDFEQDDDLIAAQRVVRRVSGEHVPVLLSHREMRDEIDDVSLFVVVLQPVGELHTALVELKIAEQRLRVLLGSLTEGVIIFDDRGTIVGLNPAAEELLCVQQSSSVGFSILRYLPALQSHFEKVALGTKVELHEQRMELLRADSHRVLIELSTFGFETDADRWLGVTIRDITERAEVEKMKENFVAMVSHELRTPISAIQGSLGLLTGGIMGEFDPETSDLLELAERNTVRLNQLVDNLLDLRQLELGMLRLRPEKLTVQQLMRSVLDVIESYAQRFEVSVVARANGFEELTIYLDQERITQVLINLLSNAIKVSQAGDAVELELEIVGQDIALLVRDVGPGIPEELQSTLFDDFVSAGGHADAQNRKVSASGIGLSVVRQIVELHKGGIDFETSGAGTQFRIVLPDALYTA